MIRNHLFTAIALAMAFLLISSCAYEELSIPDSLQDRIVATVNTPTATKTAIGGSEDGDNVVGILWTSGDKIGVFDASGSAQKCYAKTDDSGNKADAAFAVTGSAAFSKPSYAYYPYNAENDGKTITELTGSLPKQQTMDNIQIYGDYKYGRAVESTDQGHKFVFAHLFSMARIEVDATNTPLAGQKLKKLSITVKRGSETVNIAGEFTFNATNGEWKQTVDLSNSIVLNWTDGPVLTADPFTCYASLFPTIKPGDEFSIEVTTDSYRAVFTANSKITFYRENIYTFPVALQKYESLKVYDSKGNEVNYESLLPLLNSFDFKVDNNSNKLLDNKLVWDSDDNTPSFESESTYSASVNNDTKEVNLTIPYLYDFKLKPTFSVNTNCKVTVNGVDQVSGVTEVDFTKPVIYTVTNTLSGYTCEYKVCVTNTGIPVVVLKHSASGDFSEKKTEGGFLGLGKKTLNKFVNFWVRGKDTDFVKDDVLTVYNADGTINLQPTNCGAKLRGNTSQEYPKKPFAIKLADKAGASILNMPAHNRWVLLANWLDHSMIRNTVAFDIAHAIENAWRQGSTIGQGIPWNVHGQNVELVVFDKDGKGHHVGNYFLCEQIKIHEKRLNIPEPYLNETCGHLLEVDNNYDEASKFKTNNAVPFMFKDEVESNVLSAVQKAVQSIETNIYNGKYSEAYKSLDINSVIDQWLIWELAMNREYGDPRSVYMFMDSNGKLCAGPVWDFDRGTFQNTSLADRDNNKRVKPYNEWICWRTGDDENYIWYKQLIKDPIFQATVKERWAVIYPYLKSVSTSIRDVYGPTLKRSFEVDSKMWPTNDDAIHEHKSGFSDWSGDENINDWDALIDNFVTVYEARLAGMNTLITTGKFTK